MNIWIAASDGRVDLVEQYLANGFEPDSKDPNGYTPLHAAASYAHTELLKKLCSEPYNGNINVTDNDGDTPLHHCEDVGTARLIIEELGGDLTLKNSEGKTALDAFEDEAEFPELITYMRAMSGVANDAPIIDESILAQFKENVRYTLENDPVTDDPVSIERRRRLEHILDGENAEEELEQYVRELVRSQLLGGSEEPNKKRK
ncbi:LAMI_0D07932g1_1 [Lachancea mirantina]|uniref:LAMI_0D07932g1_1 n=1 Tax=Lachancea mirantina TaxID=1230905 RepID=A0A1G4JCL4_9SACH|nr:LAMI_0D07932g1_1 [Lachancea mirantina]